MELKKKPIQLSTPFGQVSIKRNQHGVPEVFAENEAALYYGQGFVQMNDRQLQAYMLKIIFSGRAAELLNPGLVQVDEYIRAFPFLPDPEKELSKLSDTASNNLQAFCEGCNAWFTDNKPRWEWKLVGYNPDKWSPEDVLRIINAFGFIGLTDLHVNIKKLIIQMVQNGISQEKISALFPSVKEPINTELIKQIKMGNELVLKKIKWLIPSYSASNNWVVGPKMTGGSAILANDPHLQIDRLPSIWQEIVLDLNGRRFKGFSVPGIPGPLTGRNPDLAWGPTYSVMDMLEYRIEEIKDRQYRRGNKWLPLVKRSELIKVKKKAPVEHIFWETDNGLLEGFNKHNREDGYYLSVHYSAAKDTGAAELSSIFNLFHADTVKTGMELFRTFESPAFNWVMADKDNNIGYQMSGKAIRRDHKNDGLIPRTAWDHKPVEYLKSDELPRVYNPKEGYIVTANDDMSRFSKYSVHTIPMATYRADRITSLLTTNSLLNVESMQKIQLDVYSIQAEKILDQIKPFLSSFQNGCFLEQWNCKYDNESTGAVYFERFYKKYIELVFSKKQIGKDVFDYLWNETEIFNFLFGFFDGVLLQEKNAWFNPEEKQEYIKAALAEALAYKPVKMNNHRKIMMKHILFGNVLPSFLGFDHGPICFEGSRATVNQGQFFRKGGMSTSFCPSFRLVTDMKNEAVFTNLTGGVSDRRFSRYYLSEIQNYLQGIYKMTE